MRALLILVELVGYLGVLYGLYLLVSTSPSSAGGEDSTPPEDARPHAAGGLSPSSTALKRLHAEHHARTGEAGLDEAVVDDLIAAWAARRVADQLRRLESSSVLDRLERLDDEAGR